MSSNCDQSTRAGQRGPVGPGADHAALTRAGLRDGKVKTTTILVALRTQHLTQPPPIAAAYGTTIRVLAALITTSNEQIAALGGQVEALLGGHPEAEIYFSQPGLGSVLTQFFWCSLGAGIPPPPVESDKSRELD